MNEIIVENLQKALIIILPAMCSLVTVIIAMCFNSFRRKIQEQNGIAALEVFNTIVDQVVRALNQTSVRYTKRNRVNGLTSIDVKYLKGRAVENIHSALEEKTRKDIKYIVKDLDSYINTAIESKVKEQKDEK